VDEFGPQPESATRGLPAGSTSADPSNPSGPSPNHPNPGLNPLPSTRNPAAPPGINQPSPSDAAKAALGANPAAKTPDLSSALRTAAVETHKVQPGDTFASLARNYYGSEKYAWVLLDGNPEVKDPRRLLVGTILKIPAKPDDGNTTAAPSATSENEADKERRADGLASPARTYRVKEGDSFYGIAREVLGSGAQWKRIYELNKDLVDGDPTRLRAGQVLKLPEKTEKEKPGDRP
jgi:nucleoid-associated protein YgaU